MAFRAFLRCSYASCPLARRCQRKRGNQLAGMTTALPVRLEPENNPQPTLVGVFVDGSVRRQGIGVELVEQVVGWARRAGGLADCGQPPIKMFATPVFSHADPGRFRFVDSPEGLLSDRKAGCGDFDMIPALGHRPIAIVME